jgi:putative membrane protein
MTIGFLGHLRDFFSSLLANAVLSIALVLSLSAGYELLEWKSVIMLGEKNADLFLGWQGDAWDAQKDMALNLAGAVFAGIIDCSVRFARRMTA